MGSSRSLIFLALFIIGTVAGGQTLINRVPFEQVLRKAKADWSSSGNVTARSDDSVIPMQREGGYGS